MKTRTSPKKTKDTTPVEGLNAGKCLNYGARLASGNVVTVEIWRDTMGFRYAFSWQQEASEADLLQFEKFKEVIARDLVEQLDLPGLRAVVFPEDQPRLSVAT